MDGFLGSATARSGQRHGSPKPVYAALLANACNISLADMARSSGMAYQVLWWASHQFLQEDDLKAATYG